MVVEVRTVVVVIVRYERRLQTIDRNQLGNAGWKRNFERILLPRENAVRTDVWRREGRLCATPTHEDVCARGQFFRNVDSWAAMGGRGLRLETCHLEPEIVESVDSQLMLSLVRRRS